ncbi:MAG: CidA/LrgA family protein [Bacteroides sp.]|nr:CidA/LrgA family protein [Bacteroides sp.]MDE6235980.1 CidA/LrgA family protein [Muribaculaceae bacterium]
MAKQFGIIFGCLALGELLALIPGLNIPGSIWGMLILTLLLERKVVNPSTIKPICKFLISNMAFFFIPPGVALMLYFDLIAAEWLPITVATVVSILLVLLVTGHLHQYLHRRLKHHYHRYINSRNNDTDND